MENWKKPSIFDRKSVDGATEIPKICSSLTENQAAILEYICQVWVFHQDIVTMNLTIIRCSLRERPSLFLWPLLPSSTEWAGRQSQWWLWQARCTSTTPPWPPDSLTTRPGSPLTPSATNSQMTDQAREQDWSLLLQGESINHEACFQSNYVINAFYIFYCSCPIYNVSGLLNFYSFIQYSHYCQALAQVTVLFLNCV